MAEEMAARWAVGKQERRSGTWSGFLTVQPEANCRFGDRTYVGQMVAPGTPPLGAHRGLLGGLTAPRAVYHEVKRRRARTRYKDEEPMEVKRRMVPVGAMAVSRMKDG